MKRPKIIATFAMLFAILLSPQTGYSLSISSNQIGNTSLYAIDMKGTILDGDFNRLIELITEKRQLPTWVKITSPGGSVSEAIAIANFVREAMVPVYAIDQCYSSCFYIWIAAVERNAISKHQDSSSTIEEIENQKVIGLHRPYFDKKYFASLSMHDADKKYHELEIGVIDFLKRMNMQQKWIDEMMMHSSENIRLVSRRELDLEFGFVSPSFEEWVMAKCPIDEKILLFGKALVFMEAAGENQDQVKLTTEQKRNMRDQYLAYSACRERSISSSQAHVLEKLLK